MAIQTSRCKPGLVLIPITCILLALLQSCAEPVADHKLDSNATLDATAVQKLYTAKCGLCHGADGKLNYAGAKDLSISTLAKDAIVQQIKYGKGTMPPQKDLLTDNEIEHLADYTIALRSQH
jgi:cytochrome c6